jgi:predicted GIY-YIG superfamily endonuclease
MSFQPLNIAQCWRITGEKSFAMSVERSIKRLTRAEKEAIISDPDSFLTDDRIHLVDRSFVDEINRAISAASDKL